MLSTDGKLVVLGILGVPLHNNPFHKGIEGIQTTNPNHQLIIGLMYGCMPCKNNMKLTACP